MCVNVGPCHLARMVRRVAFDRSKHVIARLAAAALIDICENGDDSIFVKLRIPYDMLLHLALHYGESGAEQ